MSVAFSSQKPENKFPENFLLKKLFNNQTLENEKILNCVEETVFIQMCGAVAVNNAVSG